MCAFVATSWPLDVVIQGVRWKKLLNTMIVERTDETLMPSLLPRLPCCMKKFLDNNIPLLSSVRLLEVRDVRFAPTTYAQHLREQEWTGNRTVIIIKRIKDVGECENFECSCFGKEERQKPRVAQNENFPCIRRRTVAGEGEGHQKQEAQSVNPSIESGEANYFGEEGHQKHEAPCVNSPVKFSVWSFKVCFSSTLFPVSPSGSRHPVAKTEFPGEDKASAKVDQIQHLSLRPKVVKYAVQI